ncbi:hypothetical protein [Rubrobacter aplysinae]|uniref:hypothetical protein n=1 Tax=Rubrobacter aplysinae TaxID=909625 RepID=UPI00064BA328|nr:hypothetical protein [Rubrobacter aplysinae]
MSEPIELQMKLQRRNPFSLNGGQTEGVSFRLQEWDYRHEATLMLKIDGEANADAHKSPLYGLRSAEVGDMVTATFEPYQDRRQESREGGRDSVKDVIGLRLVKVSVTEQQQSSNGSSKTGATA